MRARLLVFFHSFFPSKILIHIPFFSAFSVNPRRQETSYSLSLLLLDPVCNIYIGSNFLHSSTSFVHILAFTCLFFFLYFSCVCVCSSFSSFFFHYCLFGSNSHDCELFFLTKKHHFVVVLLFVQTLPMCHFFYLFEPARKEKSVSM